MTTRRDDYEALAPLETFDPAAFRAGADAPQELCNFVLALAVVYDDCKDAISAHIALTKAQPGGTFRHTRAWGANLGARGHMVRTIVGMVHELLKLIEKNQTQIQHPLFRSIVQGLPKTARTAWQALVRAATSKPSEPSGILGKWLVRFRNSIAFHYEPNAFGAGYEHHFFSAAKADHEAFVSHGLNMRQSRFYFADAAAIGYLRSAVGDTEDLEQMMSDIATTVERTNVGLFSIVDLFIRRRGYAYRAYMEDD